MTSKKATGDKGETLAAEWLQANGYFIIERNWRYKHWEVDIISHKNGRLFFTEVKTRTSNAFGMPEESIGNTKMNALKKAAEEYLYQNTQWKYIQFDVLSITLHNDKPHEYFFIEDVFF
jgi:putative endonuclease